VVEVYNNTEIGHTRGYAMVQKVSHWPLTTQVQIWSQPSLCRICAGRHGSRSGFSPRAMHSWFSKSQLFEALFFLSQCSVVKVTSTSGTEFSWSAYLRAHTSLMEILYCLLEAFFVYSYFLNNREGFNFYTMCI